MTEKERTNVNLVGADKATSTVVPSEEEIEKAGQNLLGEYYLYGFTNSIKADSNGVVTRDSKQLCFVKHKGINSNGLFDTPEVLNVWISDKSRKKFDKQDLEIVDDLITNGKFMQIVPLEVSVMGDFTMIRHFIDAESFNNFKKLRRQ